MVAFQVCIPVLATVANRFKECPSSGHLQTIYCVLGDFSMDEKVLYKRYVVLISLGGSQ